MRGLLLRSRYGQYWAALATVGAGLAGGYTTLAAAAARYDLVPDALALPLAGLVAAAGTVVAIRWRSRVIGAWAPRSGARACSAGARHGDDLESAAFAVIVLVAVGAVTVSMSWRVLLIVASSSSACRSNGSSPTRTPVSPRERWPFSAAFVLSLLGISVARQVVARARRSIRALSALASFGSALVLAVQLFEGRTDRGTALLVAAGVWALVFAGLQWRRLPDLALVVGASALGLAAVGTADLLSDAALTIAWAAEAIVLALLARQLGDARLQAFGVVYMSLAAVSALATDGRLDRLSTRVGGPPGRDAAARLRGGSR